MDRFLRRKEVEKVTSLKDPQMWREENAGRFPKRFKLTERTVGWKASEVDDWMSTRKTYSDSKPLTLQRLVTHLESKEPQVRN